MNNMNCMCQQRNENPDVLELKHLVYKKYIGDQLKADDIMDRLPISELQNTIEEFAVEKATENPCEETKKILASMIGRGKTIIENKDKISNGTIHDYVNAIKNNIRTYPAV